MTYSLWGLEDRVTPISTQWTNFPAEIQIPQKTWLEMEMKAQDQV